MMRLIPRLGFIQNKKHPVIVVLTSLVAFLSPNISFGAGGQFLNLPSNKP